MSSTLVIDFDLICCPNIVTDCDLLDRPKFVGDCGLKDCPYLGSEYCPFLAVVCSLSGLTDSSNCVFFLSVIGSLNLLIEWGRLDSKRLGDDFCVSNCLCTGRGDFSAVSDCQCCFEEIRDLAHGLLFLKSGELVYFVVVVSGVFPSGKGYARIQTEFHRNRT